MLILINTLGKKMLPDWLYQRLIGDWSKEGLLKYLSNTGWIFFGKIGTLITSFLATLYVARNLGPANFGELSYAISFVGLFSFFASFGIDSVLYRELIKTPEKRSSLMGTALLIKISASIFATTTAIVTALIFSPKDVSLWLVVILSSAFLLQSFYIITTEFGAIVNNKGISIISILVTLILNILKIIVIALGGGVIYLALVLFLESVLYAAGYIYLHTKFFGSLRKLEFEFVLAKQLILDAWPFLLSSAFAIVYARIDQIMLKNIIDAKAVGLYDSAVRLSELWYFIPTVLAGALFPAIVLARSHSMTSYRRRVIALFKLAIGISLVITLTVYLLASPIILTIFGPTFIESIPILQIYIWAFIPTTIVVIANQILLAENARLILFSSTAIGMVVNIIGNVILIPDYQASGAAFTTVLSSCVVVVFLLGTYLYSRIKTRII